MNSISMSKSKKYVLAGLGLLLLLGVFVFDNPQAQQVKPPDKVQVVNADGTAPGNVAITGTPSVNAAQSGAWTVGVNNQPNVNAVQSGAWTVGAAQSGGWTVGVTGTPTVGAQQTGSWNVGINGTPPVTVANLPAAPVPVRDVDNAARGAVQLNAHLTLADGSPTGSSTFSADALVLVGNPTPFTVPGGKRLVIEYASANAGTPAGQGGYFTLHTTVGTGGGSLQRHFFVGTQLSSAGHVAGAQQMRLYADPGSTVSFRFDRVGGTTGSVACNATISGYLVDFP